MAFARLPVVGPEPGLAQGNRDLRPTRDLRTVAKGLLRDHLRLPESAVAQAFPDSARAPAMRGLVRA